MLMGREKEPLFWFFLSFYSVKVMLETKKKSRGESQTIIRLLI